MVKPSPFTLLLLLTALFVAAAHPSRPVAEETGAPGPAIDGISWHAGAAIEGGILVGKAIPGTQLTLDDMPLATASSGHFIIGFHRDSDTAQNLGITAADGARQTIRLMAAQRRYDVQRIDGLKRDHVTPPQEVLDRISRDSAAVRAARSQHDAGSGGGDFLAGFDMPVTGRISGIYGSQRVLNGEPRQPHYGIDIAAPRGTPVAAPAAGRVTLVRDLYFSGWTVLVTHGMGLNAAFLHLDSVAVEEGDEVARGQVIGTVGSTGRSTGPHLDWRLDWQGRRLDAALVRDQLASLAGDS
ncbi:MAG: M23 family metallopeptidase [Candidatus Puniceispirillaceae bacterium]